LDENRVGRGPFCDEAAAHLRAALSLRVTSMQFTLGGNKKSGIVPPHAGRISTHSMTLRGGVTGWHTRRHLLAATN
jgi:hypothetical protein